MVLRACQGSGRCIRNIFYSNFTSNPDLTHNSVSMVNFQYTVSVEGNNEFKKDHIKRLKFIPKYLMS